MCDAATARPRRQHINAGTVEFIVDPSGNFYLSR
jgi:acetyl/propionyl-CoA carboxylase alpha subunit